MFILIWSVTETGRIKKFLKHTFGLGSLKLNNSGTVNMAFFLGQTKNYDLQKIRTIEIMF